MLTYGHPGKPQDLVSSSLPCAALTSPSYGLQDALHRPRVTDGRTLSSYLLTSLADESNQITDAIFAGDNMVPRSPQPTLLFLFKYCLKMALKLAGNVLLVPLC